MIIEDKFFNIKNRRYNSKGAYTLISKARKSIGHIPVSILIPCILISAAMMLPCVYLIIRAFDASELAWQLLFRIKTLETLIRTLVLIVSVVTVSIMIALPIAWFTVRTDIPFRRVWSILSALPIVIPSYVGAFLYITVFGPKALLQQLLEVILGIERIPSFYGLPGAILVLSLLSYPYILLIVRASISNIDSSIEESARSMGRSSLKTFFTVTLPMLKPAIAAGSLLVALYVISDFGAVSLMRYPTFTWSIYQHYQGAIDRSAAALLSIMLLIFSVFILLMEQKSRGKIKYHRSGAGVSKRLSLIRLGKWKWPALAFCALVVIISFLVPVSVLSYWLIRGVQVGETITTSWTSAVNSIYASGITAVFAGFIAIPVAAFIVRYPGRLSRLFESISYVGYALPGIVIGLALVFFGVRYGGFLYQTVWILIFAYIVLFFPVAIASIRSAFSQIRPSYEEAAKGLGRSSIEVLYSITLPLVRSGVIVAIALVFLITMKELTATLILGPLGFKTLATEVWSFTSEAFFAKAAFPALIIILLSSIPTAFIMSRNRDLRL